MWNNSTLQNNFTVGICKFWFEYFLFAEWSAEHKTLKYEEDQRFDQDLIIKLKLTILTNFAEASENFLLGFSSNEILQSFFPSEFTLFQVFL